MNTFRIPPETSLPIETPPCPSFMTQSRITTLLQGTFTRRPSSFRPDLIAMQSSPVLKTQLLINTSSQHSGSQPSLLGPLLSIFTLRTVTFLQRTGFNSHIGELIIVKSSSRTFWQRYG